MTSRATVRNWLREPVRNREHLRAYAKEKGLATSATDLVEVLKRVAQAVENRRVWAREITWTHGPIWQGHSHPTREAALRDLDRAFPYERREEIAGVGLVGYCSTCLGSGKARKKHRGHWVSGPCVACGGDGDWVHEKLPLPCTPEERQDIVPGLLYKVVRVYSLEERAFSWPKDARAYESDFGHSSASHAIRVLGTERDQVTGLRYVFGANGQGEIECVPIRGIGFENAERRT